MTKPNQSLGFSKESESWIFSKSTQGSHLILTYFAPHFEFSHKIYLRVKKVVPSTSHNATTL